MDRFLAGMSFVVGPVGINRGPYDYTPLQPLADAHRRMGLRRDGPAWPIDGPIFRAYVE